MDLLQIKNLTFRYPESDFNALNDVFLNIEKGSFNLICGQSGCGKTTLLRLIKREIAPYGNVVGNIIYNGNEIHALSDNETVTDIGFIGQNPNEQIVTDKVWHELVFGLENLGLDQNLIRLRSGEMANFFGINEWYHKNTDELSGGQKQILNLASVMIMQPKLLILDEPTSQLDPIAASEFIGLLQRLNKELGLTILLSEHRLEEIFPIADTVTAMESGKILITDSPRTVCGALKNHSLYLGLPSAARIWGGLSIDCPCPMTVSEGRNFLEENFSDKTGSMICTSEHSFDSLAIEAEKIWFRYEKDSADVVKDMSLSVYKGEIYSILGGNGTGKTTTLNIIAGLERPYKGSLKIFGKKINTYKAGSLYRKCLAMLPQDPKTLFLKPTLREDYSALPSVQELSEDEREKRIEDVSRCFKVSHLLDRHPYDLSGGEQQKCALVKLVLAEPMILLLDEPTKGLDAFYKESLKSLLHELKALGITILLVTHDIEFAASVSDRCALFFDGEIISQGTPNEFFAGNNFYTTAACRISRTLFPNAVLCEETISLCKGEKNVK